MDVDGVVVKNQLFDTGGTERFRNVTVSYMRGSSGCILVYDCTVRAVRKCRFCADCSFQNRASFDNVRNWQADASKMAQDGNRPLSFLLLCNKVDLSAERTVTTEEGQALADSLGADFFEVSAKDAMGIDESIVVLTKSMISQATGQLT